MLLTPYLLNHRLARISNYAPGDNISVGKEIPLAPSSPLGPHSFALVLLDFTFISQEGEVGLEGAFPFLDCLEFIALQRSFSKLFMAHSPSSIVYLGFDGKNDSQCSHLIPGEGKEDSYLYPSILGKATSGHIFKPKQTDTSSLGL